MPTTPRFHKITLRGPAPWGGSISMVRDDAKVTQLLAKGYTISRKWTVVGPRETVEGWV